MKIALDLANHHRNQMLKELLETPVRGKPRFIAVSPKTPQIQSDKQRGLLKKYKKGKGTTQSEIANYSKGLNIGKNYRRRGGPGKGDNKK